MPPSCVLALRLRARSLAIAFLLVAGCRAQPVPSEPPPRDSRVPAPSGGPRADAPSATTLVAAESVTRDGGDDAKKGALADIVTFGVGGCLRYVDGRVACWKSEPVARKPTASFLVGITDAARIEGDREGAVVIVRRDGRVERRARRFGLGDFQDTPTPAAQTAGRCVRRADGSVQCSCLKGWTAPVGVGPAVDLARGGNHFCIATRAGDVTCWGQGLGDVLGERPEPGSTAEEHVCPSEHATRRFGDVVQVAATDASSCVRRRSGEIECWGAPHGGPRPVRLDVPPSTWLRSGLVATCSIDRAGNADCWGDFRFPTLDNGTRRSHAKPVRLPLKRATAIDTDVTCAIVEGARAICWDVRDGCTDDESCSRTTYEINVP
jgi:hypothetical protein